MGERVGVMLEAKRRLREARRVAVLTGAGISKPSGIPTFRDAEGLWKEFNPLDYATPEAYARNPERVWEWYAWRIARVREAKPNPAHLALVRLEEEVLGRGGAFLLVTQNVDGLHALAGSRNLVELHGNILRARCEACGHRFLLPDPFTPPPFCPLCGHRARPDVVWFGEALPLEALEAALEKSWDPRLLDEYAKTYDFPARERIERAEAWLHEHPGDPALLRCLGLLCLREQLWGKARNYLEESLSAKTHPATLLALARLAETVGDEQEAARRYREAALGYAELQAESEAGEDAGAARAALREFTV